MFDKVRVEDTEEHLNMFLNILGTDILELVSRGDMNSNRYL
jgi:hypothetical protein